MINLINPPQPNSLDDKLDPPLGLMYIAAVLEEDNTPVKITDLCFIDKKDWKEKIGYADIYGITVFSSSLYLAKEIAGIAKENNPDCLVVVGGPHPTSLPVETSEFFDVVVRGEGEYVFHPLLGVNPIITTSFVDPLDMLPLPARHLVDLNAYTRKVAGSKATSITTSRGCPYRCAFCCKDVFGHKVRYFSIDRIVEEVTSIISNYGIRSFIFYDDTFALDRKRFYPLCEALRKLDITFRCNGDVRNNTLEDFNTLYAAGCREIAFGIESGSQEILDKINKDTTVERNIQAVKNAKKSGLCVKAFLMIGNPGESVKTIEETKRFMKEADPDQFTLFNFIPLPGCDIWKNPDKYGIMIVNRDFKEYFNIAGNNEGGSVSESDTFTQDDIIKWRKKLLSDLGKQRGPLQDYYEKGDSV
jgi:anaerobic magnesium-protoporphyrin IX monomethyl ester cyclase